MDFDKCYVSDKKKKGAMITTLAYVNPNGNLPLLHQLNLPQNTKEEKNKAKSVRSYPHQPTRQLESTMTMPKKKPETPKQPKTLSNSRKGQ